MKKLYSLLLGLALCALPTQMMAEIHTEFSAPTLSDVQIIDMQAYLMFQEPTVGGSVWESTISNDNPMGGLSLMDAGATSFYNGGMNGAELNEKPSMASFRLTTPALTLKAGTTYTIDYRSAGTRSSNNKQLAVLLVRGGSVIANIEDGYELTPSLTFANRHASFSVEEDGDDYSVVFMVTASAKTAGVSFMNIVIAAPAPEGQGALTGYNIIRNGEKVHTFLPSDVEKGAAFSTYTHAETLAYSTSYAFQLQAVYEGGESPLSQVVTCVTKADPNAEPEVFPTEGQGYVFLNADIKNYDMLDLYLSLTSSADNTTDATLSTSPEVFFFQRYADGWYIRNSEGYYLGGQLDETNAWAISQLVPEVWYVENGDAGYVLRCAQGYLGIPTAAEQTPEAGTPLTRNNQNSDFYDVNWTVAKAEGTFAPTYEPVGISHVAGVSTNANHTYNLMGQQVRMQRGVIIAGGKKVIR